MLAVVVISPRYNVWVARARVTSRDIGLTSALRCRYFIRFTDNYNSLLDIFIHHHASVGYSLYGLQHVKFLISK